MLKGKARVRNQYVSSDERPYVVGQSETATQEQSQPQPTNKIQISKKK